MPIEPKLNQSLIFDLRFIARADQLTVALAINFLPLLFFFLSSCYLGKLPLQPLILLQQMPYPHSQIPVSRPLILKLQFPLFIQRFQFLLVHPGPPFHLLLVSSLYL